MFSRARTALWLAALTIATGCGGGGAEPSSSAAIITPPPGVATVTVTLATSALIVGQGTVASATLRDVSGNLLADRAVTWATGNPSVATVDAAGLVAAVGVGTTTISATSEGRSGSATLTVSLVPVASVAVTLSPSSIYVDQGSQATAVVKDASGNVLTGRTVTWSTSAASVATVDAAGLVAAVGVGTTTISATSEGRSGSATLTVSPVPVASVAVTLSPSSIFVGQGSQATAVVKDASGNVLTGRTVTWSTSAASVATVSASGAITAVAVGSATISAASEGRSGSATLSVVVDPSVPTSLRVAVDPPPTAAVREVLARTPEVQLANGLGGDAPRANVAILVELAGGLGALSGTTTQVTDASGRARFPGLSITGAAVGTRSLVFRAAGLGSAVSSAIAVSAGAPAALEPMSKLDQLGRVGTAVVEPPSVRVRDADANPVPGARVDFAVAQGGGVVAGTPATTGADGVATATSWTLGASSGSQAVTATAATLPGQLVTFTATATSPADHYDITLRFISSATTSQVAAFQQAAARIESVVTGDIPDLAELGGSLCWGTPPALYGPVDDLLILVDLSTYTDGTGGVLAQAGPCLVRAGGLPVVGLMQFDRVDLASMESQGQLGAVILHEMLHVLGFGTRWDTAGLLAGVGTDPIFTGARARTAFLDFNGGATYLGTPVPVENTGGAGTINSHWRESVLGRELMTGWITGSQAPLSRTTVESLADLGYAVDVTQADAFDIRAAPLRLAPTGPVLDLANDHLTITVQELDAQGRTRPVAH